LSGVKIALKDRFWIASHDDWVHEGEVIVIEDDYIDVDFYDWVQRYPRMAIREGWDCTCERFLGPGTEKGTTIRDHRRTKQQA
jgi:hypothetical protein